MQMHLKPLSSWHHHRGGSWVKENTMGLGGDNLPIPPPSLVSPVPVTVVPLLFAYVGLNLKNNGLVI